MKKAHLIFFAGFLQLLTLASTYAQQCGSRQLDTGAAQFLKIIDYRDLSLQELRALPIEQIKYPAMPVMPYPNADVQRIKITKDSIPVLVFNPLHKQNLPIIIHYHGGGFISPLVPALEASLWQDAKTYGAILFAVDYRVAPEHKFPAAVDDSYNAFRWIVDHGAQLGADTNRVALMGNSAGANLVAVVAHKAQKDGLAKKIKLQVLNGLPADLRPRHMESSPSYQENAVGYFQTKSSCYFSAEMYAPGEYDHPDVSPILNNSFEGLPAAVIFSAEFDPLRDDSFLYAARLKKAGVRVWEKCFPGQIHCLIGLRPDAPALKEYETIVLAAMKELL